MSDEEHHVELSDDGEPMTYPQQAGTIRENGYIVIKGRPCKVVEVSTTEEDGNAKCYFVGIDIFTGDKLEETVPYSDNCDVPHVNSTEYRLFDISEDGHVILLAQTGITKDLEIPTDDPLFQQIKSGSDEGKELLVTVTSAMGEEKITAFMEIGPE
ncbi:hypothetical protein IGI04_032430 [Brassica rapa subsp. trilocularis]|uniref:Eukaryotic translation initiation factor 5A n=1 Tax=Brassica rapa subsp. trilocularis TaxID=1813537 RepID=A0ABQ7LWF0_BRACM|nr:hypothetical protein IGI04_032430 [Brassica rapa subsp. trilocularis]